MLSLLIAILGILITIFFVIGTHELGHFIAARCLGVKVLRFSIGFGKTLLRHTDKKGTEYVIALIPLGGYVKMLDENEEEVIKQELPFAFNRQPFYKKFLIVFAGPCINIFCAFFLYWLIFVIGFMAVKPMIGQVIPGSIAAEGGLQANQEIKRIDNKVTYNWTSVLLRLLMHAGNQDQVKIEVINPANQNVYTHFLDLSAWDLAGLTPNPLQALGIKPYEPKVPLIVGSIEKDSPAASANIKLGDKIIAIDKKPVKDWHALISMLIQSPEKTLIFTIERQGNKIDVPVLLGYQRNLLFQKQGYLGIGSHFNWPESLVSHIQYSPLAAIPHAFQEVINFTYFNFLLFGKMITGKISLDSLGGPITIFESAGQALNSGFLAFIAFLAFLSIAIGVINLIPIPGLDGGHLLLQTIEWIMQKPIPENVLLFLYRMGFLLVFFILLQALINDILRLTIN